MSRLLRYFGALYAGIVGLTLALLVVLVVAVSLVESAGELTRLNEGGLTALRLAGYATAEYAYLTLPLACFLGALVAGTQLARRGEMLAVQAAGYGPLAVWGPFLLVALMLTMLGALSGEVILPPLVAHRLHLQEQFRHPDALNLYFARRSQWFRDHDLLLYLPEMSQGGGSFTNPTVYRLRDGLIVQTIVAKELTYDDAGWWLQGVRTSYLSQPAVELSERLSLPLAIAPRDLLDTIGNPRAMSGAAMTALIGRRQRAGIEVVPHKLELYGRFAYPAAGLALVALAMPWATDPGRRRSLAMTLGGGAVALVLHLCFSQVFRLLALAHKISPLWGALGPMCVCLGACPASLWLHGLIQRRGYVR